MYQTDILPLRNLDIEDFRAIRLLVAQLTECGARISKIDVEEMISDPSTTIFVARMNGCIVGMTTMIILRAATGKKAFIDDVVVLKAHRGRKIGERLVQSAIRQARAHGVKKVELTSRPSREEANRLYQKLGFLRRETNVYSLEVRYGDEKI